MLPPQPPQQLNKAQTQTQDMILIWRGQITAVCHRKPNSISLRAGGVSLLLRLTLWKGRLVSDLCCSAASVSVGGVFLLTMLVTIWRFRFITSDYREPPRLEGEVFGE